MYLPEVVHLAVNQRLVLPLDVVDVLDVTGVEVLLHHKAQETVVRCVGCKETTWHVSGLASEVGHTLGNSGGRNDWDVSICLQFLTLFLQEQQPNIDFSYFVLLAVKSKKHTLMQSNLFGQPVKKEKYSLRPQNVVTFVSDG